MNPMSAHPTREEDFDLYALGALEDDEKLAIESHVSACSDCARKLAEEARFDGIFFVGVTTTGIYCRPVCRAWSASAGSTSPARDCCC